MKEPISYHKHKNDEIGFMLIHSVMNPEDKAAKVTVDPSSIDVQLFMNGVEFDMMPAVQKMTRKFEMLVEERAQEIVKEHLQQAPFNQLDEITQLSEQLKEMLLAKFRTNEGWDRL